MMHHLSGLGGQICRVINDAIGTQVNLTAYPDHLAAAHGVFVADLDWPVPCALRPGVALLQRGAFGAH